MTKTAREALERFKARVRVREETLGKIAEQLDTLLGFAPPPSYVEIGKADVGIEWISAVWTTERPSGGSYDVVANAYLEGIDVCDSRIHDGKGSGFEPFHTPHAVVAANYVCKRLEDKAKEKDEP